MAINHECYCVYGISGTAHAAVRGSMAGGPMEDFMELQEWKKMSWPGYRRENGSLGIRNKVLVVYTVECASHVAREIVRQADHPDVEVIGFGGCTDNAYAIRMLLALVTHPNVGAVLAVGLGCEYTRAERLADAAAVQGREAAYLMIQETGGTLQSIAKGLETVRRMLEKLKDTPRAPMGFQDLVVGAECGGSDFTSGLAGNVAVGKFFDLLEETGGTPVFEEIVEAVGLKKLLLERAADERARKELAWTYEKALEYCRSVRQYSVSPGNFAGGLTTIEEKSMGAFAKSGTKPIKGVLKVAMAPPEKGLWLLDSTPDPHFMQFGITNPNDNEGLMALISCGCHLALLVTGRGNVTGSAVAPVVKVTGNHETYRKLEGDMDFDAGLVLEGMSTLEETAAQLGRYIGKVCGGHRTKGEVLGHKEFCIPYKYQDREAAFRRCGA